MFTERSLFPLLATFEIKNMKQSFFDDSYISNIGH